MQHELNHFWESKCLAKFNDRKVMKDILDGKISIPQYTSYLVETYHHTFWNPKLQALVPAFLIEMPVETERLFYSHCGSEVGHHNIAKKDIDNLGISSSKVLQRSPFPSTQALIAYPFFEVMIHNPLSYLGYLFHLETLPVKLGGAYLNGLLSAGIPKKSCGFLLEHTTLDQGHVILIKKYCEALIKNDTDLNHVKNAIEVTCKLHGDMIEDAFNHEISIP